MIHLLQYKTIIFTPNGTRSFLQYTWDLVSALNKWIIHKVFGIRGQGGPRSIFTFWLFLIEEHASYQELFSEWKNLVPSQSYRIFKCQKYIQLHYVREL